jgi:hypothetical protein
MVDVSKLEYKRSTYLSNTYILVVVLILLVVGAVLGKVFYARHKRSEKLQHKFDAGDDRVDESVESDQKSHSTVGKRQKKVKALDIRPLSTNQREQFMADWLDVQSSFVDEPGQALIDADLLISEVMKVRSYPVSDFEQRAADLSHSYPELIGNYRAARAISLKNENQQANTEELRTAMINYRSLFDELLGHEPVAARKRSQ